MSLDDAVETVSDGECETEKDSVPSTDIKAAAAVSSIRITEDDMNEVDYDEDPIEQEEDVHCNISNRSNEENKDDDGEISESENGDDNKADKEDGELEDGELSDSDDDQPKAASASKKPELKEAPPAKDIKSTISAPKVESAWERGLREAREAMRKAAKVREEPDFETKRLSATMSGERKRRQVSESDGTPSPRRFSMSPDRRIPSLLDLPVMNDPPNMDRPRRRDRRGGRRNKRANISPSVSLHRLLTPPYSTHRERDLPPVRRNSPKYDANSDRSSPFNGRPRRRRTFSWSSCSSFEGTKREERAKELGPQVLYPNGRPENPRRDRVRDRNRDQKRPSPPRDRDRRRSPVYSPPQQSQQRDNKRRDRGRDRKREMDRGLLPVNASPISSDSGSSPSRPKRDRTDSSTRNNEISDPWARKKKTDNKSKKRSDRSNSSSSHDRRRCGSSSRSRSRSGSPANKNSLSPPRGDIHSYRIPKKNSSGNNRSGSNRDYSSIKSNPIDDFFSKKKGDLPKAFQRNRRTSTTDDDRRKGATSSKKRRERTASESDSDRSRSGSSSSSSSSSISRSGSRSASSISRSPSPAIPARYRGDLENKSVDPEAEPPVDIRDDSPIPPPPPESSNKRSRSPSMPPPPPPNDGNREGTESPPVKKLREESDDIHNRKLSLREQLRVVEIELQKKKLQSSLLEEAL